MRDKVANGFRARPALIVILICLLSQVFRKMKAAQVCDRMNLVPRVKSPILQEE